MKKIFLLILLLMTPTFVFAKDNVEITRVDLLDNSEDVVIEEPTFRGLETNFNIKFNEVEDFVKYKIIIDNDTNKDYELSLNNDFNKSEYINYKYEVDSQVLKANSKKEITLTITYNKEIDESHFNNGVFTEDNNMGINFAREDVVNPKTGIPYLYLVLVLGVTISIILLIYVSGSKRLSKYTISILVLFLIPISVFALEKLELKVNTHITVSNMKEMCFVRNECNNGNCTERVSYYEYKNGMTWNEYLESDYFNGIEEFNYEMMQVNFAGHYVDFDNNDVDINDTILDKSQGCYNVMRK